MKLDISSRRDGVEGKSTLEVSKRYGQGAGASLSIEKETQEMECQNEMEVPGACVLARQAER